MTNRNWIATFAMALAAALTIAGIDAAMGGIEQPGSVATADSTAIMEPAR